MTQAEKEKLSRIASRYRPAVESTGGKMGPGSRGRRGRSGKPRNTKKTVGRLFSYIKKDAWKLVVVFLCVLLSTITTLIGSYLLRPIINKYITPAIGASDPSGFIAGLAMALGLMIFLYLFGIAALYLQQRIMVHISQNALENLRNDLFSKIQSLPIRFFDANSTGDLMSRFTNDVDTIGEVLNNTVVQLFSGSITLIGTLAIMLYTNFWLTLVTLALVPLIVFAGSRIAKHSSKYFSQQQAALGAVNGYAEESVTGQKVIKVFCHEDTASEEFALLNGDLKRKQVKAQFLGGIMGPVMGNLSQINYALTAAIGGVLCAIGRFDIGGLAIFVNYSRQFSRPINEISMQMSTVFSALAGAERVFTIMDEQPEFDESEQHAKSVENIKGDVRFENVTFGYVPEKTVLHNLSLYAKPGQKIAFVGSTGAGKTTITNLLTRFYEIKEGRILLDGVDIREFNRESLRKNISMVLQDTHLFTGTVRENIRYGRLSATDEEVEAAAKLASAHSFIMRLPDGYDTVIEGDGANLSQGQRQLLNIARAAIANTPILVLDEATSSVDTRTERHIEHGLDRLMQGKTTFIIAHRLSTVRNANAVMVLEHGEIIERGTHQQLLEQKGRYYQLYTGAAELD